MGTFAAQLTHLFMRPYLSGSRFDRVCRLVCKNIGASCASILIYTGREDEIHCRGRYIDPGIGKISITNDPVLVDIMRNICTYDFLYAAEEKICAAKQEALYNEYIEDALCGETISREDFSRLLRNIGTWKETYQKLQNVFQAEKYSIKDDSKWLSGRWFKSLLKKGKTYSPEVFIENLDEVGKEEKIFCLEALEEKLNLKFSAQFYVALPLFAIGRYFGVLRLLFPNEDDSKFISNGSQWELAESFKEKCLDIAQQVSYHLEIHYFLNGYKNTILFSKKHARVQEPLEQFLNSQCELLSGIIKSRGALIQHWNEQTKCYEIAGYSQNIMEYIDKTGDKDQNFFKAFAEKFQKEKILGVYFNCMDFPFEVTKFIYNEDQERLSYQKEAWDITVLKDIDIHLNLIELQLVNIAIFPISGIENYFIVLYNTENQEFLDKDIQMIYPAIKNFGLELQARQYIETVEKRMNIISRMHHDISIIFQEKNAKTYRFVIDFLRIISETINCLEIFPYHILWEYVSEILPDDSPPENRYILRNITREKFQDNPFQIKQDEYRELTMSDSEFSDTVLNYFTKKPLTGLFKFPPDNRYSYLDLPFFAASTKDFTAANKLLGIITLIYPTTDHITIAGSEFFNFMEFFSNQLSIAWEQFQERVAVKIQEKLDHEIRFDKKENALTKKEELTLNAKVMAEEFQADLCCFFLANEQDKILKLEAGNIPLPANINYSLVNDINSLSVRSYLAGKNFRIFGRKSLEENDDLEKLTALEDAAKDKIMENYRKKQNYTGILIEHWLSDVITIGEKKLGLIKLFRVKGVNEPTNDNRFDYVKQPFSDFESSLLNKVQKHIFNIIFARQTIQQRMEDMRNVLHQVIAPLNALMAQTANITQGVVSKDSIPEKLVYMNALAKIAAKYARNFQKILDLDTSNIKLYKEIIPNLRTYLIGLAIDYQALIKSKCIHIFVTPDTPNNIALDVDKDLFDHAVSNLIDNAVKYSFFPEERIKIGLQAKPRNPYDKENVLITAQDKNNSIVITISNWGIAMSEEERKNIFKREFRGAKALDWTPVGTGIGLFLAREIIKLHKGQIELVPGTHENHIIFKITLPKR